MQLSPKIFPVPCNTDVEISKKDGEMCICGRSKRQCERGLSAVSNPYQSVPRVITEIASLIPTTLDTPLS